MDWLSLIKTDIDKFNTLMEMSKDNNRAALKGLNLNGLDLTNAQIKGLDLSFASLKNSKINGYQLSTCRLEAVDLQAIEMEDDYWRTVLDQIELIWKGKEVWNEFKNHHRPSLMNGTVFSEKEFDGYDLSNVAFVSSDFNHASFFDSNLKDSTFRASN